jgi:hypothetical protein
MLQKPRDIAKPSNPSMIQKAREAAKPRNPTALDKAREVARQAAQNAQAAPHNPTMIDKAREVARLAVQNAQAASHHPSALDKAKEVAKEMAEHAAHNPAMIEKAKAVAKDLAENAQKAQAGKLGGPIQTPANPADKLGSNITPSQPPRPPHPDPTPDGRWTPRVPTPGGVVILDPSTESYPVAVQTEPTVPLQTVTSGTPLATSRPVSGAAVANSAPRAPTGQITESKCNCLVKEYVQGGGILFMDICTAEYATSVPTNEGAISGRNQ